MNKELNNIKDYAASYGIKVAKPNEVQARIDNQKRIELEMAESERTRQLHKDFLHTVSVVQKRNQEEQNMTKAAAIELLFGSVK